MGCIAALVVALLVGSMIVVVTFNPPFAGNEGYYCAVPLILTSFLALILKLQRR